MRPDGDEPDHGPVDPVPGATTMNVTAATALTMVPSTFL